MARKESVSSQQMNSGKLVPPNVREKLPRLTAHAWVRMCDRSVRPDQVDDVLLFGRISHTRGAVIYAVGRKDISYYRKRGIDIEHLDGLQVVCSPEGTIMTVYRNRDFHGLRITSRFRRRRPRY